MIHIDLLLSFLVPHRVKEHIHRTFLALLHLPIQHWNPQHDTLLPCTQHGLFSSILGLAIEVWRIWRGVGFVGCCARLAVEDVVGGDVDEEGVAGVAFFGEAARGLNLRWGLALREDWK